MLVFYIISLFDTNCGSQDSQVKGKVVMIAHDDLSAGPHFNQYLYSKAHLQKSFLILVSWNIYINPILPFFCII